MTWQLLFKKQPCSDKTKHILGSIQPQNVIICPSYALVERLNGGWGVARAGEGQLVMIPALHFQC